MVEELSDQLNEVEVRRVRRTGLIDFLQREYRVSVAGPTTLAALLNSLQMGFKTRAIQKRSSEAWAILGAVKTDFGQFGDVLRTESSAPKDTEP